MIKHLVCNLVLIIFLSVTLDPVFASDFKWCVSTAAHQIEGGNFNSDWWEFEQIPGKIKNHETSQIACDHWNRVADDIDLIKALGVNAYRMSVEWAKIEPNEGVYDPIAILHYRNEISQLIKAGIKPIVTLHHFSLPQWISKKGGWNNSVIINSFKNYTNLVYSSIAPEVTMFVTINEPMVNLEAGYGEGIYPPGKTGFKEIGPAIINTVRAHAASYHELHRLAGLRHKKVQVGLAHHLRVFSPLHWYNPIDVLLAGALQRTFNDAIPNAVKTGKLRIQLPGLLSLNETINEAKNTQDFFGMNYYTRDRVTLDLKNPNMPIKLSVTQNSETNDLGWEIYPEGLRQLIKKVNRRFPGLPIYITENGTADKDDLHRGKFILDHLKIVEELKSAGVPILGYCHWSLMDNFEWEQGYFPRFGLYEVDYLTQKRTLRPSAKIYQSWIADH